MHAAAVEREAALRLGGAQRIGRLDHHRQLHRLADLPPTHRAHCGRIHAAARRTREELPVTGRRRIDVGACGDDGHTCVAGHLEAQGGLRCGCAACLRGEVDGYVEVVGRALHQRTRSEVEHESMLACEREAQVVDLVRVMAGVRVGIGVGVRVRVRVRVPTASS